MPIFLPPSLPLVPPVLSTSLAQTQTVTYGDPLSLTCSVTNTAITHWLWYHNGIPLPTPPDTTQYKVETTDTSHEGIYQCFAYNLAGNISSTIHISVMGKSLNINYMYMYLQVVCVIIEQKCMYNVIEMLLQIIVTTEIILM